MTTAWQTKMVANDSANDRPKMPASHPTEPSESWYRNQPRSKRMPAPNAHEKVMKRCALPIQLICEVVYAASWCCDAGGRA